MKNKSKLQKIKAGNNQNQNRFLPDGWFVMAKDVLSVADIKAIFSDDQDIEIWPEAGIMELVIGEKASIDIEAMELDLKDPFSEAFLQENEIKSLFYLSFRKDDYDLAKSFLKQISDGLDEKYSGGFICGDTEDFTPQI